MIKHIGKFVIGVEWSKNWLWYDVLPTGEINEHWFSISKAKRLDLSAIKIVMFKLKIMVGVVG